MINKKYDVMNDVKKQNNDSFLTNLSKERTKQNTALGMNKNVSSGTIKTNRYNVEK